MDLTKYEKTGTDSWSAGWCSEGDAINAKRRSMGTNFPKKYSCLIKEDGTFASGKPKFSWVLVSNENETQEVITTRAAMKLTSRLGKQYIQVRRFSQSTSK